MGRKNRKRKMLMRTQTRTNHEGAMILKTKDGKLFEQVDAEQWEGYAPVASSDVDVPIHRWHGLRMPLALHRQVLAFFAWSLKETSSETMANWYYHPVLGWAILVFPQKGYQGMQVNAKLTDEVIGEWQQKLPGVWDGVSPFKDEYNTAWKPMGTGHHHCRAGAFQSSGDHADELNQEGLHITIGGLGDARYSLHARVSFRGIITPARLSDWYELPADVAAALDVMRASGKSDAWITSLADELLADILVQPAPEGTEFPEWWKGNVQRQVASAAPYSWVGDAWNSGNRGYVGKSRYMMDKDEDAFKEDVAKLCKKYEMDMDGMEDYLIELECNDLASDLILLLHRHEIGLSRALVLLDELARLERYAKNSEEGDKKDGKDDDDLERMLYDAP